AKMDECESLDSEMTEPKLHAALSQPLFISLSFSLREVVQDQSVKPKVQCLMVDPSFSMVTVQSEDSGIVWETASSRCSTPWASETSSISEAYSMEGSGAAGKINIVFDEDKVVRRKTRSGGRSSRLGDRLSRPGSSRSASALGVERLEMVEVSVPNVKQEKPETEPDLEEIKNKDQQLFSLISEGYEILNIRVPSKLPTVDEEESTELTDNLSYLDQTPKIKSREHDWTHEQNQPLKQDLGHSSADTELGHTPTQQESTSHIDYFEKFTLLDEVIPGEQTAEVHDNAEKPRTTPKAEEQKTTKETTRDSPSASEESFVFVTDVEIVGEHLDEVFYGEGAPADALQQRGEDEEGARLRNRRESQRSTKESGAVLFEREETILTPIYISPGPPKIIDPILLEEPTAMSFMYSDLYEDAVGEKRRSDEEYSEAESVASEKSYKRRLSDSEEADGYLEKFILKDETPTVEVQPESEVDKTEGRMMWSQSEFEMTGCLIKVIEEEEDKKNTEELKMQEASGKDRSDEFKSAENEQKRDIVTENEREKIQLSIETEEQAATEVSEMSKLREDQEMKYKVKRDQRDPPESSTDEPLPDKAEKTEKSGEHQREEESAFEAKQPCQTQEVMEITEDVLAKATQEPGIKVRSSEVPSQTETTERNLSEEPHTDIKMVATDEKVASEAKVEASAEIKEPEIERQQKLTLTEPSAEIETSSETLLCEEEQAAEDVPEDIAHVEVITDCDSAVHAVVEITEKAVREKEVQTQVQIDLQEATSAETTDVREGDKEDKALRQESTVEEKLPELFAESHQKSEIKTEMSSEVTKSGMSEDISTDSHKKGRAILQSEQHEQEESVAECESDKMEPITETKVTTPSEDSGNAVQEMVNVGGDLILLVPKGQAVEMDVNIDQWSDKTASVVVALPESVTTTAHAEEVPMEEAVPEPLLEVEPEVGVNKKEQGRDDLNRMCLPPVQVVEVSTEEQKTEKDLEEDEGVFSPLRSFTPHEDLSGLQGDAVQPEEAGAEQKGEIHKMEDTSETKMIEAEVPIDEPEYEVISKQDAKDIPEYEIQRATEKSRPECGQDREERMEVEMEEKGLDLSPEEELIEADYEIIDAEEASQARMAAELLGMDWFCLTCGRLLSQDDRMRGEHHNHEVKSVDKAYEEIKKLGDWISELQGRSENIEDLVSELELAYNSVEVKQPHFNEEVMALVMEQYNTMSISMEEEKKSKLEQLYDQIVSFQESIDSAKATLETTAREAETDAPKCCDCVIRLKAALDTTMSLELGPKGLLVFEDYAKGNTASSHLAQRKGIPVSQRPTLQPQEPGSATSTSVTVYWTVNPGDIIDCFQVYCMEDPQGAVSEEYRVTVKESYCVLEELEPDKKYKVWVMAVNYTGCSLPSEKLTFRTAPSVPVIDTEHCSVMWDSATLRWNSTTGQSYTLEYCRQYELEGEGLRSIAGIRCCEQRVLLQPNENYLFYIKAVNEAGASEQSEAALISTKGTRFQLLKASAHPALELSVDETTLHYSQDTHLNTVFTDRECPSILGELFPARGRYYWETIVSQSSAYRLGVQYSTADRNSSLGENRWSWCLQCIPTPSGCRYQLLHNDVQSSVFVIETPERVGTLLDYPHGRLSFYNALSGQLLGTFSQRFTQPCHPALALEMPGSLEVSMVLDVPEFTKNS
uniref:Cardiomyopathy associated 5 n=1 Tax=Anabas testudineus TaxID=64144 RepID=A0A3Q1HJP8_ANATE